MQQNDNARLHYENNGYSNSLRNDNVKVRHGTIIHYSCNYVLYTQLYKQSGKFANDKLMHKLMREKQTDSWLHNMQISSSKERLRNIIINQLSHIMPVDNNPVKCMCSTLREKGLF